MQLQFLKVEEIQGLYLVEVNRPKALNALNDRLFQEFSYVFKHHLSSSCKGVIIKGSGDKAFVAGADIKEFVGMNASQAKEKSLIGKDVFAMIERSTFPVIALIDGYALGGGLELALACHIRIATPDSMFGCPEISLGIVPGWGAIYRLPKVIGKGMALDMILTGKMITAQRAHQLGLISHIVGKEEIEEKALKMLKNISKKSKPAIIEILQLFADDNLTLEGETKAFSALAETSEFKEGVAAFLNKK